jgi:prophage antirepressor-like protein
MQPVESIIDTSKVTHYSASSYFKETRIDIYGNLQNPLFDMKSICDILDLNYIYRSTQLGPYLCRIIYTKGPSEGINDQKLKYVYVLTWKGVYTLWFDSKSKLAQEFNFWFTSTILTIIDDEGPKAEQPSSQQSPQPSSQQSPQPSPQQSSQPDTTQERRRLILEGKRLEIDIKRLELEYNRLLIDALLTDKV